MRLKLFKLAEYEGDSEDENAGEEPKSSMVEEEPTSPNQVPIIKRKISSTDGVTSKKSKN